MTDGKLKMADDEETKRDDDETESNRAANVFRVLI
jgi:hypothetical protein